MKIFSKDLLYKKSGGGLRHIQVGDDLKNKTLYFNFPDTEEFKNYVISKPHATSIIHVSHNNGINGILYWNFFASPNSHSIRICQGSPYENATFYNIDSNILVKNLVSYDTSQVNFTEYAFGVVDIIDINDLAYQYIWVDPVEMGD